MKSVILSLWESTAPIPTSEASTSTTKSLSGFGTVRMGAELKRCLSSLKADSASGHQLKLAFFPLVRADRGATTELKFKINLR